MQEAGGTFPRLALLGTIAVGLLGAIALFAYIGLRLLLASAMTLLLLLLAPAILIAPALGDGGRAAFVSWGKRLLGALLAKLVYSIFLTIVLAASQVFTHLDIGWFGTWLMLGAFWWGVFLKRNELIEFVAAGTPRSEGAGMGQALSQGYYAWMLGRGVRQLVSTAASPATTAVAASNNHRAERREALALATQDLARDRLDTDARRSITADQEQSRGMVQTRNHLRDELHTTDQRLRGFDEASVAARATNGPAPVPTEEQQGLIAHRQRLQELLMHPAASEAEETVRHADRNRALTGEPVTQRDLDVHRARRARELRDVENPTDERHLRAAGIDPAAFDVADPDHRAAFERQAREHLVVERGLHEAAEADRPRRRRAPEGIDAAELATRAEEHRRRLHQERRQRRAQRGIYR